VSIETNYYQVLLLFCKLGILNIFSFSKSPFPNFGILLLRRNPLLMLWTRLIGAFDIFDFPEVSIFDFPEVSVGLKVGVDPIFFFKGDSGGVNGDLKRTILI
jgi:hypothetical protein